MYNGDAEMGRSSWIIRVGPKCNDTYPYIREANGELPDTEGHVKQNRKRFDDAGLESWSNAITGQEML